MTLYCEVDNFDIIIAIYGHVNVKYINTDILFYMQACACIYALCNTNEKASLCS